MANSKISALTSATTPLAGTEVLPIVQSSTTVKASIANIQTATVSGGTANGIQYLNGSKVSTTGSTLQYDGTKAYNNLTAPPSGWTGIGTSWWVKQSAAGGGFYAIASGSDAGVFMGHTGTLGKISVSYGNTAGYTPLGFYTSDTLQWQLETNGNLTQKVAAKGVNFTANTPAAGMTSQLLNWYEEGTWTPNVNFIGITINTATYTRVGRHVTLCLDITFGTNTDTNLASINGLPFTVGSSGTFIPGYTTGPFTTWWASGGSTILATQTTTSALMSGKRIIGSATYFV